MLGLVGTVDKPISVKIVPSRSYLINIAGNLYGGVSHGRHFQFRHSIPALEGKRRRKTDFVSIKMLWRHVRIVHRHSEKSSLRKHIFILRFGPFDHCLESGEHSVHLEGILNPNIGDLPFGKVDQSHRERGPLFFRTHVPPAHVKTIFIFREEFFANLALFDLATFSKLAGRSVIAGAEGARKRGRRRKAAIQGDIGQALFGVTKQASGFFETKPVRKIIQGFARNCRKNPVEMKFREAGNISQLSQLHRAMQIPAKIVDDPINSLGVFAVGLGLVAWHGLILCHRNYLNWLYAVRATTKRAAPAFPPLESWAPRTSPP